LGGARKKENHIEPKLALPGKKRCPAMDKGG